MIVSLKIHQCQDVIGFIVGFGLICSNGSNLRLELLKNLEVTEDRFHFTYL